MRDFTRGKIGKSIFLFSLPLVLGNVFQQLYTLVNSAFVGAYLGDKALAAVGSVYPIVFFLVSLVIGIGSGGSVVVSHFYGAKKNDGIPLVISTFYVSFIILGLVVCGLSILFAPYIFSILNLNGDIMQDAVKYMRIYMIGMFFSFCFNSIASILRGLGDSRTQLSYLISANVLNVLLSYVFLAVFHLDLVSTAWASVISQFAAFVALLVNVQKKNEYLKIRKRTEYFDKGIFREIVRIGLPTGVQQSVVALAQILILGIVVRFGTNALAAYSAASRIESIALLVVLNLSSALTSFVGHNFGAGQIQRVRQGLYGCIKIVSAVSLITFMLFFFFARKYSLAQSSPYMASRLMRSVNVVQPSLSHMSDEVAHVMRLPNQLCANSCTMTDWLLTEKSLAHKSIRLMLSTCSMLPKGVVQYPARLNGKGPKHSSSFAKAKGKFSKDRLTFRLSAVK